MRQWLRKVVAAGLSIAICASAAWSSGFHPPMASFVARFQPEPPLDRFAAGRLGVIQSQWRRDYLYVCYRYMAGPSFDPDEQKALLSFWNERPRLAPTPDASNAWIQAANRIPRMGLVISPDAQTPVRIETYARGPLYYMSFLNCNDDAFNTAVKTLDTMVAKFGASSAEVRQWLEAQNMVFRNCPGGKGKPHIPPPLNGGTPFEQAQRAYQIACANFYSGNFDTAASMFTAVAADPNSPWREIAPYLVARTTIRKATLSGRKNDDALLAKAEGQLNAIVVGSAGPELKAAAKRLLGFVGCRLHPHEREAAEVRALMQLHSANTLEQTLNDYRTCGEPAEASPPMTSKIVNGEVIYHGDNFADDLDDWIATVSWSGYQPNIRPGMHTHSIDEWKRKHSTPWLIASLSEIGGSDPNAPALMKAGEAISPDAPAYVTAQFHIARLLVEQGMDDEARKRLDTVLAKGATMPHSAVNQFSGLRLKVAHNFDEFLRYAPRYPVAVDTNMFLANDPYFRGATPPPLLDIDSAEIIDRWLPISVLKEAPRTESLPRSLRAKIAPSIWLRMVLLGDDVAARGLAPIVGELVPDLRPSLEVWSVAKSRQERRFALAMMLLRHPGMRPYVSPGLGRLTSLDKTDEFRDNWWPSYNAVALVPYRSGAASSPAPTSVPKYPNFLSAKERASADREWNRLSAIDGPEFLCRATLERASVAPKDERVPEALYRCISAVHLGPATERSNDLAKRAFRLLHRRYGGSEWAQRNEFWYQGGGAPTSLAASFERNTQSYAMVGR
jgi:hypothetical protein